MRRICRYSVAVFSTMSLLTAPNASGQSSPRWMILSSVSSAGGELSERGSNGGSGGISLRVVDEKRKIALRTELSLHVFRSSRSDRPSPVTSATPYFPAISLLAYSRPATRRLGIYGLAGPAALGSYGPTVWGLGAVVGVGARPSPGRFGLEGRVSAARVPNPDIGPKRFFDARFLSLGMTFTP
jgi:hypothetical protein